MWPAEDKLSDAFARRIDNDFTILFREWPALRLGQDIEHLF